MFLKNKNIIFKVRRSKVTDYAALTLCMLGNFFMVLLSSDDFFKNYFKKIFQQHNQSVKGFGSRSGPTFCPDLIGAQSVCKGYQQTTKVAAY